MLCGWSLSLTELRISHSYQPTNELESYTLIAARISDKSDLAATTFTVPYAMKLNTGKQHNGSNWKT